MSTKIQIPRITLAYPTQEYKVHATKQKILAAFDALARETGGKEKFGPTELGAAVEPPLTPSLVSSHLKGLVADGLVERCPQGTRRALYRIVERPSPR